MKNRERALAGVIFFFYYSHVQIRSQFPVFRGTVPCDNKLTLLKAEGVNSEIIIMLHIVAKQHSREKKNSRHWSGGVFFFSFPQGGTGCD